jgi:hypothetical protein
VRDYELQAYRDKGGGHAYGKTKTSGTYGKAGGTSTGYVTKGSSGSSSKGGGSRGGGKGGKGSGGKGSSSTESGASRAAARVNAQAEQDKMQLKILLAGQAAELKIALANLKAATKIRIAQIKASVALLKGKKGRQAKQQPRTPGGIRATGTPGKTVPSNVPPGMHYVFGRLVPIGGSGGGRHGGRG